MRINCALIISILSNRKKRCVPTLTRITHNITACYRGRGDFCRSADFPGGQMGMSEYSIIFAK